MSAPATPIAHFSRRYRIAASHRLHSSTLSAERNRELFGKCNNPFGHGHNYRVQITLAGPIQRDTGMVVNLADLDGFVQSDVLECFDYTNLNEHPAFLNETASTENLCLVLWPILARFAARHTPLRLERVRVEETDNNAFDYFGEGAPVPSAD